jgi:hypothetical protein
MRYRAEVSCGLLHIDRTAFVDERRVPRENGELAHSGKLGNEVLRDAVCQSFEGDSTTENVEREDTNAGFFGGPT